MKTLIIEHHPTDPRYIRHLKTILPYLPLLIAPYYAVLLTTYLILCRIQLTYRHMRRRKKKKDELTLNRGLSIEKDAPPKPTNNE
jgi:hypothetical protein